jgi:hypothetical protein
MYSAKVNSLLVSAVLFSSAVFWVTSCTEKKEEPEVKELGSFELIQQRILTPNCATAGCHASEQDNSFRQHGLVLSEGKAYDYLIEKAVNEPTAKQDGLLRVSKFNSIRSLLYHKLVWDAGHHGGKQYGLPMPLGGDPLYAGPIEFVRRWIEAGAPREGSVVDTLLLSDRTPSFIPVFSGLEAPVAGQGVQLKLGPFTVAPNFERELFVRKAVGNTTPLYINRFEVQMRQGSHHFILYDFADKNRLMPAMDIIRDLRNADGSTNIATFISMQNHVFWAGTQTQVTDYSLPSGAALLLEPGASFDLNSHYVNKGSQPLTGEVHVNLHAIPKEQVKHIVKSLNLGNEAIQLPPQQQTVVRKTFTFPKARKILMLTSHTHQYGKKFVIRISGGTRNGQIVYESTDWEHPQIKNFVEPLELKAGEGLTSEITYFNTSSRTVFFGLESKDEMGIIFGYYID